MLGLDPPLEDELPAPVDPVAPEPVAPVPVTPDLPLLSEAFDAEQATSVSIPNNERIVRLFIGRVMPPQSLSITGFTR